MKGIGRVITIKLTVILSNESFVSSKADNHSTSQSVLGLVHYSHITLSLTLRQCASFFQGCPNVMPIPIEMNSRGA